MSDYTPEQLAAAVADTGHHPIPGCPDLYVRRIGNVVEVSGADVVMRLADPDAGAHSVAVVAGAEPASREDGRWPYGTLARVTALNRPTPYRAVYDGRTWREVGSGSFCVDTPTSIEGLVILDPSDPEEVGQVVAALAYHHLVRDTEAVAEMLTAALERLRDRHRPVEPRGLGAVVQSSADNKYVRVHKLDGRAWMIVGGSDDSRKSLYYWSDVHAVAVLNEGTFD